MSVSEIHLGVDTGGVSDAVNDPDSDIDHEDTCESLSDIGDLGRPTVNMIPVLPKNEDASPISQFGEVDICRSNDPSHWFPRGILGTAGTR